MIPRRGDVWRLDDGRSVLVLSSTFYNEIRSEPTVIVVPVFTGEPAAGFGVRGIFGTNQAEYQSKTLLALLPGVPRDVVPEDLHRLNRFSVAELTRAGVDDLLRAIFNASKYIAAPVAPPPSFEPAVGPPHPRHRSSTSTAASI